MCEYLDCLLPFIVPCTCLCGFLFLFALFKLLSVSAPLWDKFHPSYVWRDSITDDYSDLIAYEIEALKWNDYDLLERDKSPGAE